MTTESGSIRADLAVVGGGVIGLAVACEMQKRGRDVLVLEMEEPGSGATQAAGGMLGPIAEAQIEEPEIITLGLDSLARYPEFVRWVEKTSGGETGFREEGTLIVAVNRDHLNELEHLKETFRSKGLTADSLTSEQVLDLEPRLSPRVLGGLKIREDQRIDPRRLAACLAQALVTMGGTVLTGAKVHDIVVNGDKVSGLVALGNDGMPVRVDCTDVVIATGASRWDDIRMPAEDPGIRPIKGQLVRLRGETLLRHVVRSPDIYLIPQPDGELFVGATMEEMGYDMAPTAGAAFDLLRFGWQLLPGIYDLEFLGMAVGQRPAVDDHMPVIGPADTKGLWLAVGHFRKGVLMAPATASYLADWMESGEMPEALASFAPGRLSPAPAGES
ncbi:MAG: glycine oxidase ThiO [Acidobacteria bacterium]|uniref:Glycine oxidase ThiO n=1 Tax=Candidatus Polarisedimenticola svalbardensis TaxID=2886004 RepID=A0A8J7CDS8_9BACT|nr:glycine oxidase ThiO [Candidatus Polarisedimenticola svalbardensis]